MFNKKIIALLLSLFVLTLCLSGCSNKEKVKDKSIKLQMIGFQHCAKFYGDKKDTFRGIYSGEVDKDGYPDGDGKYVVEKADDDSKTIPWYHKFTLVGNFSKGVFTEGKMIFTDTGKAIEGKFQNGKLNGEGKILFKDGSVQYKGAFHDNYPVNLKSAKPDYVVSYEELQADFRRNNNDFTKLTKEFRDKYDQYVIVEVKGPVFDLQNKNDGSGNTYSFGNKDALKEDNIYEAFSKASFVNVCCPKEDANLQITKDDVITIRTFGEIINPPIFIFSLRKKNVDPQNKIFKQLNIDNGFAFSKEMKDPSKLSIVRVQK